LNKRKNKARYIEPHPHTRSTRGSARRPSPRCGRANEEGGATKSELAVLCFGNLTQRYLYRYENGGKRWRGMSRICTGLRYGGAGRKKEVSWRQKQRRERKRK